MVGRAAGAVPGRTRNSRPRCPWVAVCGAVMGHDKWAAVWVPRHGASHAVGGGGRRQPPGPYRVKLDKVCLEWERAGQALSGDFDRNSHYVFSNPWLLNLSVWQFSVTTR